MTLNQPKILVARAVFPEVLDKLARHFDVQSNQDDALWTPAELAQHLQGKVGVFTTGSQRIDATLLAASCDVSQAGNAVIRASRGRRGRTS